ncbi:HTTM domain-containing protein [Microbacterium sp. NPDC055665]
MSSAREGVGNLWQAGESWILDGKRASYGIAVTRMLLGGAVLGVLLTNFSTRFYTFGAGMAWTGQLEYPGSEFMNIWPFGLFLQAASTPVISTLLYLAAIAFAVLFIIGYRTRLASIGLFVMWIAIIESNTYVNDQSDNLIRIALIVMFFAAPSTRWSLDALRRRRRAGRVPGGWGRTWLVRWWRFEPVLPEWFTNSLHNFAIIALACQVSFIYVSGGLYKAGGGPWSGGTAIYDPLHVAQFAPWPELSELVTAWGPGVAFATVLTLLVQTTFPLLLLRRGTRIFALVVMLCFHLGIALLMGLPWFSLAMIAIDAIFIRDVTWRHLSQTLGTAWRRQGDASARVAETA